MKAPESLTYAEHLPSRNKHSSKTIPRFEDRTFQNILAEFYLRCILEKRKEKYSINSDEIDGIIATRFLHTPIYKERPQ